MAKAKAKAAKKSKGVALPAGFEAVAVGGSFGNWHDFQKVKVCTGKVTRQEVITQSDINNPKKKVKRRIIGVLMANGVTSTVGESYALRELFDMKLKGKEVFIRFDGVKKLAGRKKLNQFTVAVR